MDGLRIRIYLLFAGSLFHTVASSPAQRPCQCINIANVTSYPSSALTTPCGPCFVNTFPLTCCVCNETERPSMMECRALSTMWNAMNGPTCALSNGQFLLLPASSSRLALCGNLTQCHPATEYEVLAPTSTSDRQCDALSICGVGTYQLAQPTPTTDRICRTVKSCLPELEFMQYHATPTSDRVCVPITTCQIPFEFQRTSATLTSDATCSATSMCDAAEFVTARPTPTSDTMCAPISYCEWYEYEVAPAIPGLTNTLCAPQSRPCDTADGGELLEEVTPPSASTDRMCGFVHPARLECPHYTYRMNATVCAVYTSCTALNHRIADRQHVLPSPGGGATYVYQAQNATATSDVGCLRTTPCNLTAVETVAPTATTNRMCAPVESCLPAQFVMHPPTATSNTVCHAQSTCTANEVEAVRAIPGVTDAVCVPQHACGPNTYTVLAPTDTSDAVCGNVSRCGDRGQFQVRPATVSSNTLCATTTPACDTRAYFEVIAPTATGNRVCYPVAAPCAPTLEVQEAAPTATTDRLCLPVYSECKVNESFEVQPPTLSSTSRCQALTQCSTHQVEVLAPTASSDRTCDTSSAKHKQIVIGGVTGMMTFIVSLAVGLVVLQQWRKQRRLAAAHDFTAELERIEAAGILAPDRCFIKNSLVGFRYLPEELDTSKLICLNTVCGSKYTDVSNGVYTAVVGEQGQNVVLKTVRLAHTGIGGRAMGKGLRRLSYEGTFEDRCDVSGIHEAKCGLFKEAAILAQLQHVNVVALVGVVSVDGNAVLVLEDCSEGALDQLLTRMYKKLHPIGTLNHNSGLRVALDVASGLEYLQTKGYVHKDVCAHNVLVTKDLVYKLTDFGMSEHIRTCQNASTADMNDLDAVIQLEAMASHDSRHALRWCAPETVRSGVYTHASDVWAYGILLYEVYTWAKRPYQGLMDASELLRFLDSGKRLPTPFPRECNHGTFLFSRVMMCCWHSDADLRPSFSTIVSTLKAHLQASKEAAAERSHRRESRARSRTIRKVLATKRSDGKNSMRRETSGSDIYSGEGSLSPYGGTSHTDTDEILPRQTSISQLQQQTVCFDDGNMSQSEFTPLSSMLDLRVANSPNSPASRRSTNVSPVPGVSTWMHDDLTEKLLVIDTDTGDASGHPRTTRHRISVTDWQEPHGDNCSATSADEEVPLAHAMGAKTNQSFRICRLLPSCGRMLVAHDVDMLRTVTNVLAQSTCMHVTM
eukprot:m.1094171 g.1094171  ORF g.1094171 m.1094171 type:complete len:1217 (-) comp24301_c0_seq1:4-3654(-)